MSKFNKNKKAFSLIETMVVIIIMGILIALAMPRFTKVVERNYAGEAALNLTALHSSIERCTMEFNLNHCLNFHEIDIDIKETHWLYTLSRLAGTSQGYAITALRPRGTIVLEVNDRHSVSIIKTGWFQ